MKPNPKLELTWIGKEDPSKREPRILIEHSESLHTDRSAEKILIRVNGMAALAALEQTFARRIKVIRDA